jgi:hypothetical protein
MRLINPGKRKQQPAFYNNQMLENIFEIYYQIYKQP